MLILKESQLQENGLKINFYTQVKEKLIETE